MEFSRLNIFLVGIVILGSVSLTASIEYTAEDAVFAAQCYVGIQFAIDPYLLEDTVRRVSAGWHSIQQSNNNFKGLYFNPKVKCFCMVPDVDRAEKVSTSLKSFGCKSIQINEHNDQYKIFALLDLRAVYLKTGKCLHLQTLKSVIETIGWDIFFEYKIQGSGRSIMVEEKENNSLLFTSWPRGQREQFSFVSQIDGSIN